MFLPPALVLLDERKGKGGGEGKNKGQDGGSSTTLWARSIHTTPVQRFWWLFIFSGGSVWCLWNDPAGILSFALVLVDGFLRGGLYGEVSTV